MVNSSASSSVQAAVVNASSMPVPQNQGKNLTWILFLFLFLSIISLLFSFGKKRELEGKDYMCDVDVLYNVIRVLCCKYCGTNLG